MPTGVYKHTEAHCQKQRENMTGSKNPMYGKRGNKSPSFGKHHSEETRRKMRNNHANFSGSNHPNYGKTLSDETRKKMSISKLGKSRSEEAKQKHSKSVSGMFNPMFGKPRPDETKRKMRVAALRRILRDGRAVSVGKNESVLLDRQEQVDGVCILRQYPIEKLGYIVDGYCSTTNTVYEVYETYHKRPNSIKKDIIRQKEIEKYLGCKFVIIWDR